MKTLLNTALLRASTVAAPAGSAAFLMSGLGPRIMLAPDNEGGTGTETNTDPDPAAEAAAAEAAAAAAAEELAAAEAAANQGDDKEKKVLLREVMDKKTKLKEATTRADTLAADLKKFEGVDVERYQALVAADQARETQELEAKGEWEALKTRMAEAHATEKAELEAQIAALRTDTGSLSTQIEELTIGQNFATSKFVTEDLVYTPSKARKLYGPHFERVDGKVVGYDKPKGEAGREILVDAAGKSLDFEAAMKKLIDADPEKESLLKVKSKPGAQSKTSQVPTNSNDKSLEGLTGKDRLSALLAKRMAK